MPNSFYLKDILSIKEFSREDLECLFKNADKIKSMDMKEKIEIAKGKLLGFVFYEPSSRTKISFETAMLTIGGHCTGITDTSTSSIEKGENLADTISTISGYTDAIVLRHPLEGAARFSAEVSNKPVINAGSGTEEHPTQAMIDLYTMYKEKGKIDGLKIGIMGDLRYGRTVYSLLYALSKFSTKISLISPQELRLRENTLLDIRETTKWDEYEKVEEIIQDLDVLYVTRIQKERFPDPSEYQKVKDSYFVDKALLEKASSNIIVLHPLPRIEEIRHEVDSLPQAKYFIQAHLGKDLRSALLGLLFNADL